MSSFSARARAELAALAAREKSLILATIEVRHVKKLFEGYERRGVEFSQGLVRQAWGGIDFHVRDLDGNVISFVEYRNRTIQASK